MNSYNNRLPKSLALLGLSFGFSNDQFNEIMCLERSDELRELAYKEWESEQAPEYDNVLNYRWYLSYVSMKNEYTQDFNYIVNSKKNLYQP